MSPEPLDAPDAAPPGVSVVVPVYFAERTLRDLVRRLEPVLAAEPAAELVLVNDGSTDESWRVIQALASEYPWVRGVDLSRNFGQHNALLCGIRHARYAEVVTMDDDLQNPPEEIPALLACLRQGHDVVYGVPDRRQHGAFRDFASWLTKWILQRLLAAPVGESVSAFRAFRRRLVRAFEGYQLEYVSVDVLLSWGAQSYGEVEVAHAPRAAGTSNYTLGKLLVHAVNMVTGYSIVPLRMASFMGLGLTLFGALLFAYVILRFLLQGSPVPGFPFLASAISIFSGAQLFALGIIGEYLGRVHARSVGRPPYLVRAEVGE